MAQLLLLPDIAMEQMPIVTMDYLLLAVVILTSFLPAPLLAEYGCMPLPPRSCCVPGTRACFLQTERRKRPHAVWLLPSLGLNVAITLGCWRMKHQVGWHDATAIAAQGL